MTPSDIILWQLTPNNPCPIPTIDNRRLNSTALASVTSLTQKIRNIPTRVLCRISFIPFFEHFGAEYNFLSSEDVLGELWDQRLSPALANCIAAIASRYSNIPELSVRGLHNVAEAYTENAKNILNSIAHIPTFDTLHALMLLSWSEYKINRIAGFRAYCQLVMRMAMDLGLSDQNIQLCPSERERTRMRATWANIVQLHLRSSSCR